MKNPKNHNIHAKLASIGVCCVRGYILQSAIEGKSAAEAMAPLKLHRLTFYHHCKKVKDGTHHCQQKESCLFPSTEPSPGDHNETSG